MTSAISAGRPSSSTTTAAAKQAPPCTLVIFGAGGDLTKRLLMPSLYDLASAQRLDDGFKVHGVDLAQQDTDSWRKSLTDTMQSFTTDKTAEFYVPKLDDTAWTWVTDRLSYQVGDFSQDETFAAIKQAIGDGSAIFYCAVAARFFGTVIDGLGKAGLLKQGEGVFRRVVIEKPFGSDLPSAQALNARILQHAEEEQFFRIDHFLGKDTVQSIMAVRFGNAMFEPTWRREYIDHVEITAAETVGVEGRGKFYEPTGALRDMVPNHMFTLLAMVAMEPPTTYDAEAVRSEKAKLMQAIRPLTPGDAVRGQYGAGSEFGKPVPGYREEPNVAPDSRTETYVALRLAIENWRWAGVPFYVRTGKRLSGRKTEISVHYKPAPYRVFGDAPTTPNVLRLLIDPEEGIDVQFAAKQPGPEMALGRVVSSMRYKDYFDEKPNVGYETLLYDCMQGDTTLFQRADAIEASWAALQPVLESWAKGEGEVETYSAGSSGPAGADSLLAADGRTWSKLVE